MSDVNIYLPKVLHDEGSGYVADDHGRGPSKFGITLQTLREWWPQVTPQDILALTSDEAKNYYAAWWYAYHFNRVDDQSLAEQACDLGVNQGPATAIRFLQRGAGMPESQIDGVLGPATAATVNALPPRQALIGLIAAAADHYRDIRAKHPDKYSQQELDGWLARLHQRLQDDG